LKLINEDGATFKSYMGGKMYTLTPESSIKIQRQLGADLIVVLDECTPFNVDKSYTERSMHMSHRWAVRSLNAFNTLNTDGRQALYGIIQGGVYEDLREAGTDFVNSQPFFGHAVGGSLGASKDQMEDIVSFTMSRLSRDRPVHLLGIGGVRDIFHGVEQGIDTFDCVHPTRLARHGGALVRAKHWRDQPYKGSDHLNMRNAIYREDPRPIDSDCACDTCKNYSRAYLHHLFKADELLGLTALTVHNVAFMNDLLKAIRNAIAEDRLQAEKANWLVNNSEIIAESA
jgi:queuine tRNA-ribosyltransferase